MNLEPCRSDGIGENSHVSIPIRDLMNLELSLEDFAKIVEERFQSLLGI